MGPAHPSCDCYNPGLLIHTFSMFRFHSKFFIFTFFVFIFHLSFSSSSSNTTLHSCGLTRGFSIRIEPEPLRAVLRIDPYYDSTRKKHIHHQCSNLAYLSKSISTQKHEKARKKGLMREINSVNQKEINVACW